MAHTVKDEEKLLSRVRRIRGQVEAIERALKEKRECEEVLHVIAACRGALNGLMAEVLDDHLRLHIVDADEIPKAKRSKAAGELMDILRTYLK